MVRELFYTCISHRCARGTHANIRRRVVTRCSRHVRFSFLTRKHSYERGRWLKKKKKGKREIVYWIFDHFSFRKEFNLKRKKKEREKEKT